MGSGLSQFGTGIYSFAMGLYVLKITESAMSFAITMTLGLLPTIIFSPMAGVLCDKMNKKKIVVLMDCCNGLLFLLMYLYMTFWEFNMTIVYSISFFTHAFLVLFNVTMESGKPMMVDDKMLTPINSVSQILSAGSGILSPLFGGLIFAFVDIKVFILTNSISFVLSACLELFIDFQYNSKINGTNEAKEESFLTSMKSGWTYLIHKESLVKLLGLFALTNFLISFSATVPLPYILNNHIGMTPEHYGIVNGILPVGMIIGALFVGFATRGLGSMATIYYSLTVCFMTLTAVGLPYVLPLLIGTPFSTLFFYSGLMALFGMGISLVDIPILTIIQSSTDEIYRGRVISLIFMIIKAINPLAFILSGLTLNLVNPFLLPLMGGIIALTCLLLTRKKWIPAKLATRV